MSRLRILILAEDCNPDWPSLPVVGYKAARAIAEVADVTLATHVRNQPAIERDGAGGAKVVYIDNEFVAAPMYKVSCWLRGGNSVAWTTNVAMAYLPYLVFERMVWRRFRTALAAGEFDVVHRLTPMSPTLPSPMAKWSPVPFVLGPLNGGLRWPAAFRAELRREREWVTHLRAVFRLLPYSRSTYKKAAAVLGAFPHTLADLPVAARPRSIDLPEVGIDPELFHAGITNRPGPLTFLFVGRLVPYKCADVAVEAFVKSSELRGCRLRIVGDGPELPRLRKIVSDAGADDRVEFLGWKKQAEVGDIMRQAHVFVFPSIRELGAGVVVEAMACGLCCLVVNYGGPGGLIDDSRGRKVELTDKPGLVARIRAELEALASNPELVSRLAEEGRRHVMTEYSWAAKAAKVLEVYRWVTGRRPTKPCFAVPEDDAVAPVR